MSEVQDVFVRYGEDYRLHHKLSHTQAKAMKAIQTCRTAALGGHLDACPKCGYSKPSYNSCRNRHCPKCQAFAKERWIDARKADLIDTRYFHVVFTIPAELNATFFGNQRCCYDLLFRCVSETIQELSADKKYLGAAAGLTAVLHTWGQNLHYHPHIHCIVPAGGLSKLGKWLPSRKNFFLPVKVLSKKFRGKLLAMLKQSAIGVDHELIDLCYKKDWGVYCKPPFRDAACVVEYLGRYTHRVAISNNRILSIEDGSVSFKWRDYRDGNRWKVMTLSADEFIRRFLMHILPAGFMKIRHYGFLSSRGKQKKLPLCKLQTGTSLAKKERFSTEALIQKLLGRKPSQCPCCGHCGLLQTGLAPPAAC